MTWSRSDRLFFITLIPSSVLVVGLLLVFLLVVTSKSYESLSVYGLGLFTTSAWHADLEVYGVLSPILGTFLTSTVSTLVAMALSTPLAIFIAEYLGGRIRDLFASLVEMMSGVPTVVYAVWALDYLAPFMKEAVLDPLHRYLWFIPLFSCKPVTGFSMLTAGVAIGLSITPYTTSVVLESYRLIPQTYREACFGIGMTRHKLVETMLSMSSPALLAVAILGFARASGETTIAATVVGNAMTTGLCLIGPGYTIPALIASQYANANLYRYAESALYAAASVILVASLVTSFAGLKVLERWRVRVVV